MATVEITIDDRRIEVPYGTKIIDAAQQLGIEIPTLCYLKGYEPSTSCQVCMVKDRRTGKLLPACGTRAEDGMEIENDTDEIARVRRTALELLLSEHVGDCRAPCDFTCPAHMDIPLMLEQINAEQLREAIVTIKEDIALPAILGRVCPKPCEKGCRRQGADGAVAICDLKRYVADWDLAQRDPYLPECEPDTGKQVGIVGSGPTGLAAAFYLRRRGHGVTIIEARSQLGGRLRTEESSEDLPESVLDAEIRQIVRLGVETRLDARVADQSQLEALAVEFDAVLVACGAIEKTQADDLGLRANRKGIDVHKDTYQTNKASVFAAGNALRGKGMVVRSAADGKEVAAVIDRFLRGEHEIALPAEFSSRIGKVRGEELDEFCRNGSCVERVVPDRGVNYDQTDAAAQADRCLACACSSHGHCRLEYWSEYYGADPARFPRERSAYEVVGRESNVLFEPGKCIKCELCIKIAEKHAEPLGLTFVGRGFDVQVSVPFGGEPGDGLREVAAEAVAACPTAALSLSQKRTQQTLLSLGLAPDRSNDKPSS